MTDNVTKRALEDAGYVAIKAEASKKAGYEMSYTEISRQEDEDRYAKHDIIIENKEKAIEQMQAILDEKDNYCCDDKEPLYYQARKDAIEDACPACHKSIKECAKNNKYLDCIDKTFYGTDLEYINTKGGFCLKCTWKFIGELSEIFLYPDCDDEYIKEQMEDSS